mmetsp:Transcript_30089/g.22350  ORF Transcript_30089/g.22350 Transcript_30089/m.22350 type:complete len:104 (+) Transcript_30089:218-529(+)|eukprot:CAMPEP_0202960892 /NCGR_PEP_ID=MMETSP1396-20130829/5036_1 /ASSEMBLY_ACC=CAM_ASM_000872 /TAXON_ID= /ORGANISM="Pseudokeronopsis sp., Strain Brazil" /LENGTH=103 /DNA_ID=CAMNT_0049680415 /DNA_START=1260 /DNA_END=1571 /DNA_ORIENTATION=+
MEPEKVPNVSEKKQNFYKSTYKNGTHPSVWNGKPAEKANCDATIGNFKIGYFPNKGNQSENRASFKGGDKEPEAFDSKQFGAMIQRHNFELNFGNNGEEKDTF